MKKFAPLPENYVARHLRIYGFDTTVNNRGVYNCGCPICKEGNSWGKAKRLFYFPTTDYLCCHNCGFDGNGIKFIAELTGRTYKDIVKEVREESTDIDTIIAEKKNIITPKPLQVKLQCTLPYDVINLMADKDTLMKGLETLRDRATAMQAALYCIKRGLRGSVNEGPLFYSEKDFLHKGRVIIPFNTYNGKLQFFQSRCIDGSEPRYISSTGFSKSIYGLERISLEKDYVFIQEGPFNTFFLKNSIAIGGINPSKSEIFSSDQLREIAFIPKNKIIFILDNPALDKTAKDKQALLTKFGYHYFNWNPELEISKFKDLNDYCMEKQIPGITEDLIVGNCVGLETDTD